MDPTRTPLESVVIFVSGISSDERGTFGGMCEGRVGPMERDGDMVYCCDGSSSVLILWGTSEAEVRVITGGSFLSGNSFSENLGVDVSVASA